MEYLPVSLLRILYMTTVDSCLQSLYYHTHMLITQKQVTQYPAKKSG
jgi:hypothetical protein